MTGLKGSVEAIRRKIRALAAVSGDAGATEHERANAEALKTRLKRRLNETGTPAGDWTDNAFRLGRWAKEIRKSGSPATPKADWTETAHSLGKAFRRSSKKWL
jgi:hypothetical protein